MAAERRREVLVEAGHRCAIPTCKQIPVEVHHIDGRRGNHAFSNLIALCPNCHSRADAEEIDRPSLRIYKANLGVLVSRYGDLERRVLDEFVHSPDAQFIVLPRQLEMLMSYLVHDEMVECSYPPSALSSVQHLWETRRYDLTDAGRVLVESLREGRAIEP